MAGNERLLKQTIAQTNNDNEIRKNSKTNENAVR